MVAALGAGILPGLAVVAVLVGWYREAGRLSSSWVLLAVGALAVAATVSFVSFRIFHLVGAYIDNLEQERLQFHDALRRLGDALAASPDRDGLVQVVVDITSLVTAADTVTFHEADGGRLELRATTGPDGGDGSLAAGEGVVGAVVTSGAVRWPPDTEGPSATEPAAGAALAVPVPVQGRLFGVIGAYRTPGRAPFAARDLDDLVAFGHNAGAALQNTFLQEETQRLSLTDDLTTISNRRQFELRCAQELERSARFGEPFALLVCDLDDFKSVNDRFFHSGGDAVLVECAQRLVEATRTVDFVGRYGGEEFVMILPMTDCSGAEVVAEHIRAAVSGAAFETGGGAAEVTVSVGIACYPDHGRTREHLVGAADAALFMAKAAGKNAVRVAPPPDSIPTSDVSPPRDATPPGEVQ